MNNIPDPILDPPEPEIDEDSFDGIFKEKAEEMGVAGLLDVPGVYELVREHLNDKIIELHLERKSECNSQL